MTEYVPLGQVGGGYVPLGTVGPAPIDLMSIDPNTEGLGSTTRRYLEAFQANGLDAFPPALVESVTEQVRNDLSGQTGLLGRLADDAFTLPTAAGRGVAQIPGFLGDAMDFGMWLGRGVEGMTGIPAGEGLPGHEALPRSADMAEAYDDLTGGVPPAQTRIGADLQTGVEWGAGALSPYPMATMLPAFAGGILAEETGSPELGLLGTAAGGLLGMRRGANQLVRDNVRGVTDTDWQEALQRQAQAYNQGTPLLASEALGTTGLLNLTSAIRQSGTRGSTTLDRFFAERPQSTDAAFRESMDQLSQAYDPAAAVNQGARTAEDAISTARGQRSAATTPLFEQLDNLSIDPAGGQRILDRVDALIARQPENSIRRNELVRIRNQIAPDGNLDLNAGHLWGTYQGIRDTINLPVEATGSQAVNAGILRDVNSAIRAELDQLPEFQDAVSEYARLSEELVNPLTGSEDSAVRPIANELTRASNPNQAGQALVNPDTRTPAAIQDTLARLRTGAASADESIAGVMRAYLTGRFNSRTAELAGGPREAGGAVFRADVFGNQAQRQNIQTVLREIDPDFADSFDSLMDAYERMGQVPSGGSQTAMRQWISEQAGRGNLAAQILQTLDITRGTFLRQGADLFTSAQRDRVFRRIADILVDDNGVRLLREAAQLGADDPRRWILLTQAVTASRELSGEEE